MKLLFVFAFTFFSSSAFAVTANSLDESKVGASEAEMELDNIALAAYKKNVEQELTMAPNNWDYYLDNSGDIDLEKIEAVLRVIERGVLLYERGSEMVLDEESRDLRSRLKERISSKQIRIFPKLRDKYGPLLRDKLWIDDGSANTVGKGYRTIKIYHGSFALNREIQELHTELMPLLISLRFTRAEYHWVDSEYAEYVWYEMEPPKDSELGTWAGTSFRPAD